MLYKIIVQEQIAGRVSQQGQLGGNSKVGTGCLPESRGDLHAVAPDVSHDGIDLQECYFHRGDKKNTGMEIKLFGARKSLQFQDIEDCREKRKEALRIELENAVV